MAQPSEPAFLDPTPKCSYSANYKLAGVSSFNQVISLHLKNSVEHNLDESRGKAFF